MGDSRPVPSVCCELLDWLDGQPNVQARVLDLPEDLRDPDVLAVSDKRELIEFGRLQHVFIGLDSELRLEGRFNWFHLTRPDGKPMKVILHEDANREHPELRLRLRLTSAGSTELAEWRLRQSDDESSSPQRETN